MVKITKSNFNCLDLDRVITSEFNARAIQEYLLPFGNIKNFFLSTSIIETELALYYSKCARLRWISYLSFLYQSRVHYLRLC